MKIKLFAAIEIQYFELRIFSFNSYVYYVTRGSLASTRAFNLLTRAFNIATRAFNLLARGSEHVIREFELTTCRFELATRGFELLTLIWGRVILQIIWRPDSAHRVCRSYVFSNSNLLSYKT